MTVRPKLRPATPSDGEFLRTVHAQTHGGDLCRSALPPAMLTSLLDLQFTAQQAQYATDHPAAIDQVIELAGVRAGRCWTDRTRTELRLLDLAVLPRFQRQGIAGAVLDELIALAQQDEVSLRLSVWSDNVTAVGLYARRGLTAAATDTAGTEGAAADAAAPDAVAARYLQLQWSPTLERSR